jgi:uncharacterized protein (TIGR02266 family)
MVGPVKEQRRHARLPCRQRCWCEGDDITIYAQIGNLSEGGLFLRTSAPLPPGARVRVRLGGDAGEAELRARVAWRRDPREERYREQPGMGLRFEPGDEGARAVVRSHLDRLRSGS